MNIVRMKLTELHPVEKNVRRHSQKQIAEYARSLDMFQQLRPLVIDEDGTIWIGNGMYEAMKSMGWEYAECEVRSGLTDKQKKKMMMADNRIYELGMTDTDVFDEIIRELDGDTDVPGWDADLLETLNASIREVDEMVDGYGSYAPEDVERINQRQSEPVTQNAPYQPLQHSETEAQASGAVDACPQEQTEEAAIPAQTERYVICPKCGERICL